jgi:hypothetical protein
MAELAPAFWLASTRLNSLSMLESWLKLIHVQPRWLDEIVLISSEASIPSPDLAGMEQTTIISCFPAWLKSQQPLIHDASRKAANGEKDMILLIAQGEGGFTTALISSPAVIGRYNLIPQAYLEYRLSFHLDEKDEALLDTIQTALQKDSKSAAVVNIFVFHSQRSKRPVKSATPFAGAAWLNQEEGVDRSALSMMHDLTTALATLKKKNGLVVEIDAENNLFSTWLEAV